MSTFLAAIGHYFGFRLSMVRDFLFDKHEGSQDIMTLFVCIFDVHNDRLSNKKYICIFVLHPLSLLYFLFRLLKEIIPHDDYFEMLKEFQITNGMGLAEIWYIII